MESLPKEVLFVIFQNLHPLELISLSRVNRRWHDVALHPRLHRCLDLKKRKYFPSCMTICKYISTFKHSLEELDLQECYWLKGAPLSCALQKCRKLKSLNVMGCDVTKKTICSVLKLNEHIRTLEWSIKLSDVHCTAVPSSSVEACKEFLTHFCHGLADAFAGLDCLTIRFPVPPVHFGTSVPFTIIINSGVPFICSGLCLKKFQLQWFEFPKNAFHCVEIVIEGSGFQFPKSDVSSWLNGTESICSLKYMTFSALVCQLDCGVLQTFLLPDNLYIRSPLQGDSFKKLESKTSVVNMDLGALRLQDSACLSAILSVQSLRYLNITGLNVDGHLLQVIATTSPNLEFLNLQDCIACLEPPQGLTSLAACCPNLAQLNLSGVHYQASKGTPNDLLEIISKFNNLVSLSLCACCCVLGSVSEQRSHKSGNEFRSNLLKSGKRVCHGDRGSSRVNSHDVPMEKFKSSVDNDSTPWHELSSEGAFDRLAKACSKMTEFELIHPLRPGVSFQKTYHKSSNRSVEHQHCVKSHLITSEYGILAAVTKWTSLQRLTLAAPLKGSLKSLVAVTRSCPNLQFLSLAAVSNLGHSGNVILLQDALSCCHQLRDFRLEQPNFSITESFMQTLSELKHLERVCIIAREGTMKMYSQAVVSLFEKCCKLYYFQVLCGITVKASKAVMDSVSRRFAYTCPGLVVSVVPFHQDAVIHILTSEVANSIPVVHLQEIFLFGTTVATRIPV